MVNNLIKIEVCMRKGTKCCHCGKEVKKYLISGRAEDVWNNFYHKNRTLCNGCTIERYEWIVRTYKEALKEEKKYLHHRIEEAI